MENLVAMAIGEVAVVACSVVDATDIRSTGTEQIPVGEVEGVETRGEVELVQIVAVVVTGVVLVGCVRFVIPDNVYLDFHFVGHVLYYLFRSFY